jgi:ribonuclease Z
VTARALVFVALLFVVGGMWVTSLASKHLERVSSGVAPIEPRRFDALEVVTAGTGGTFENHLRLGPVTAVGLGETVALVDLGRGAAQALRAARIPVDQPRAALLTSLLPENVLGLDDWIAGAAPAPGAPLRVLGPAGTRALVEGLRAAHRAGTRASAASFGEPLDPPVEVVEAGDGLESQLGALSVRATAARGGPLPALAWRFEGARRAVVVSSAGWDPEALVSAARGADLWVHEALYGASLEGALAAKLGNADALAREGALHTRLEDVGALAARAGVKKLALVRLRPPPVFAYQYRRIVARSFRGPIHVADDGEAIRP